MEEDTQRLKGASEALGHKFNNVELLREALTHRSFINEQENKEHLDNERMEFLGDAVLSFVASAMLCHRFPNAREGALTRHRASLVSEKGLSSIASELELGSYMYLGKGEERSGGRNKPRLLASVLEACIAAVYLDAGVEPTHQLVEKLLIDHLENEELADKDLKSRAQEYFQRSRGLTPCYVLQRTEGPEHQKRFWISMQVGDEEVAVGEGRSKSQAEQQAAKAALELVDPKTDRNQSKIPDEIA